MSPLDQLKKELEEVKKLDASKHHPNIAVGILSAQVKQLTNIVDRLITEVSWKCK